MGDLRYRSLCKYCGTVWQASSGGCNKNTSEPLAMSGKQKNLGDEATRKSL